MELPSWASEDVDIEHPSPARVYDDTRWLA
jgi:hypothetical protein